MTLSTGKMAIKAAVSGRVRWHEKHPFGACVVCGCTQEFGCPEGCSWIVDPHEVFGKAGRGLCDVCLDRVLILLETPQKAWNTTFAADICRLAPINAMVLARYVTRQAWRRLRLSAAMKSRGAA